MQTYGTSRPATVAIICSSARPPETSLTHRAPASTARPATSDRMVSMLTQPPAAASVSMTGRTRRSSSPGVGSVGARPGGFTADVDDVGPLGHEPKPVPDRVVGVEPLPAVGERVRCHVHHPHHQGATRLGQSADEVDRHGGHPSGLDRRPVGFAFAPAPRLRARFGGSRPLERARRSARCAKVRSWRRGLPKAPAELSTDGVAGIARHADLASGLDACRNRSRASA